MPIPAGITPITVTGTFTDASGSAVSGYVVFTPSIMAVDSTDNGIVTLNPVRVNLDANGHISVSLASTDDPQWTAPGWTYRVDIVTTAGGVQKKTNFNIAVPAASSGGTLDLADAAPLLVPGVTSPFMPTAGGTFNGDITLASGIKLNISNTGSVVIGDVAIQRDTTNRMKIPDVLVVGPTAGNYSAAQLDALPKGDGSGQVFTGIVLASDYSGGDDDGAVGHFDSTQRVYTYAYQRANSKHYGEQFRGFLMRNNAKHSHAVYAPVLTGTGTPGWDGTTGDVLASGIEWTPVSWGLVTHYKSNDGLTTHGHTSFEFPDSSRQMQTRFEFQWSDRNTGVIGLDKTFTLTNQSDFVVRAAENQSLRIGGSGVTRNLEFSKDFYGDLPRWKVRVTNEAESTGNAGSHWEVARYNDDGTAKDTLIRVRRDTGLIAFGHIANAVTGVQVSALNTGLSVIIGTAADRYLQGQVTGDANRRFIIYGDGKLEWGDGTSRDTILYRSAADKLATDDDLLINLAGKGLRIKEGSNAKQGVSTLVAGTLTVANTSVTATSRIQLTAQSLGTVTTPKALAVTARTSGTSFTITSADATDTSVVAWQIIEPA